VRQSGFLVFFFSLIFNIIFKRTVSTPRIELLRGAVKAFGLKLSGVKLAGEPADVVEQRLTKVLGKVG
jgi:hypothetical protein